jgi:hypothetical protein
MRSRSKLALPLVALAIASPALIPFAMGCMGDGGADCPAPPAPPKDAAVDSPPEASTDAGDGEAGKPAIAGLRLANLSPDAPAVDFCVAPHGTTTFQGPLLAAAANGAGGSDGGVQGIAYQKVSKYFLMAAHAYDVRVVVAGATDCSFGLVTDDTMGLALNDGSFETIALMGKASVASGASALKLVGFFDDPKAPPPADGGAAKLSLRFLHAAPDQGTLDLAVGSTVPFKSVSFGQRSMAPPADAGVVDGAPKLDPNGYWSTGALQSANVTVRPSGDAGAPILTMPLSAAAGAVITLSLVGESPDNDGGSGTLPLQLLECVDNAAVTGLYSNCSPLTTTPEGGLVP